MSKQNISETDVVFFDKLYIQYYQAICKYISTITNNRVAHEDIAQETFYTAWDKIKEIRQHPSPKNWLYKTAKNKTLTAMKKKMNYCEIPTVLNELDNYIIDPPVTQSIFDDLKSALNDEEVKLIKQRFIEGYSIKEICEKNSIKCGTGTMKFSRIYKKLKVSKKAFS